MNENNLRPIGSPGRTKNEEREIQRKGGVNSGASRRRKRDQRKLMETMLKAMPELDKAAVENLKRLGFTGKGEQKDQFTVEAIGAAALLQKVMRGDVRAYRLMLEIIGEDARTKTEQARLDQERQIAEAYIETGMSGDGFLDAMSAQAEAVFDDGMDEPQNLGD